MSKQLPQDVLRRGRGIAFLGGALAILLVMPAAAGMRTGTLLGTVSNSDGTLLTNAVILVSGNGEPQETRSDDEGLFRFRDLDPGNYGIEVKLDGYSTAVYEPVHIRIGWTTTVQVQMSEMVEETIVVTSEPPSPAITTTGVSGLAILAPIPLGRPLPRAQNPAG